MIYCADDPGAVEVASIIEKEGRGIVLIPYGFNAKGNFRIGSYRVENGKAFFSINAFEEELVLKIPGRHQVLNAAAAITLASVLNNGILDEARQLAVKKALEDFCGSKRRSEIIGEAGGILFMDDYGHHPTAIKTTLEGLKSFYPSKRLVVSFMSHTYTRTAALLDDFALSLALADVLFLHKIYASAREKFDGDINGKSILEKIENIPSKNCTAYYVDEPMDAVQDLKSILKPGDIFLTMGAGNNWPLGTELYGFFREQNGVLA